MTLYKLHRGEVVNTRHGMACEGPRSLKFRVDKPINIHGVRFAGVHHESKSQRALIVICVRKVDNDGFPIGTIQETERWLVEAKSGVPIDYEFTTPALIPADTPVAIKFHVAQTKHALGVEYLKFRYLSPPDGFPRVVTHEESGVEFNFTFSSVLIQDIFFKTVEGQ